MMALTKGEVRLSDTSKVWSKHWWDFVYPGHPNAQVVQEAPLNTQDGQSTQGCKCDVQHLQLALTDGKCLGWCE